MELIGYKEFGRLRMARFAPPGSEIIEVDNQEWMGGFWITQGVPGGTSVSFHEDTPDEAGGLEVGFGDLPEGYGVNILEAVRLPLLPGMTRQAVEAVLGRPKWEDDSVGDRLNCSFWVGSRQPYHVFTTIHHVHGLIYVAVVRKDVLARCEG